MKTFALASRQLALALLSGILLSATFFCGANKTVAAPALTAGNMRTSLIQQFGEQNLPIPSIERTYTQDRVGPADTGDGVDHGAYTVDPYDGVKLPPSEMDGMPMDLGAFLNDPGIYFSKYIRQFLGNVIRPLARKLSAVLLIFVLNPNIAADGLRHAHTDVQKLFNQTADVMFYIAIDLSLILFVVAIWRHWADSAWRGQSGTWMSAVGRLVFTIGLILLWKTIYTLELDLTNEMIRAVWFNDPAQRNLLVSSIETIFMASVAAGGGILLSSFAPLMGALGGSVVGGPTGMIIGGAAGSIAGLAGWILFIVLGVIIITEVVYFLVLKAIQEALLAAQFLVGYCFLVCFASPDTEHMATGFVRSFIEVSLWSFVWLILLKILVIVLNSNSSSQFYGAQILLIIGVLQIMIQVPSFMGRAQISPISEFLTAGAVTGLVSKGLSTTTDSIKKAITDISDYQLNAKYASVGTPETTATTLKMPTSARAHDAYEKQLDAPKQKAGRLENGNTSTNKGDATLTASAAGTAAGPTVPAASTQHAGDATQPQVIPVPPSKSSDKSLDGLDEDATHAAKHAGRQIRIKGSAATSKRMNLAPPKRFKGREKSPTSPKDEQYDVPEAPTQPFADPGEEDSADERSTVTAPVAGSGASTPRRAHPQATKGLSRVLAHFYTNARMRPWVQDLNDGTNMANYGPGNESTIHMGERGARMVQFAEGADAEEMGFTVAAAAMATDLANNPRGRDAARRSVLSRHLDQPRTLGEHLAAAALYVGKGQYFNQTKLGQSRGQLGMLDELVNGSAHYLTLGDAGHENDVSTQLAETFRPYDEKRQAATLAQMTDEDSTESGLNRSNASATRINISHGFQINDLMRAVYASHMVAGTRIGQRDKAIGMYNYIEAMAGKSGSQMGNDEAQPLVNAITPEEADACMVISRFEGPEACRNPELVRAVAEMAGTGSNRTSHESAFAALRTHVRQNSSGTVAIGDASPAEINNAAQAVQQLRRAGFDDTQIANPEVAGVVAGFQANAVGNPTPQMVQAVLSGPQGSGNQQVSPAQLADQVLRNIGAQPNAQNRQIVVQMMNHGYEAKDITYDDFKIAGAVLDHGGGNPSPEMIQFAQAQGYTDGRKLSKHTVAQGLAARLTPPGQTVSDEQIEAAHVLLGNHVRPEMIDENMLRGAVLLRAHGASAEVLNPANMEIAQRMVANNVPSSEFTVNTLNAAKYISPQNQNAESLAAARHMIDAEFINENHPVITDQALYIGKGLIENKINPTPEIVAAVMKDSDYQKHPYQYGITPPGERAQIPQQIVARYVSTDPLPPADVTPPPQPFNPLSGI